MNYAALRSANNPSPLPTQSPVPLYESTQFDMRSQSCGRTYRVFVFKPVLAPPPSGYPVVTVVDANMCFPIAATMGATFMLEGKPALVVGVGYPTEDVMQLINLRRRDLTPPTPAAGIPQSPGQPPPRAEDYGGSNEFYRFLTEELRPAIASAYRVDAADQTLYGHSMGGLFTLGVLLGHPESFRNFVASSPSIFWNDRSVLGGEAGFRRRLQAEGLAPRVLISVGSREQEAPDPPVMNMTREEMRASVRKWRMVDNARELAGRLQRMRGRPGYLVQFHAFEDEDHQTALPASIGRTLAFALRPSARRRSWLDLLRPQPRAPGDDQDAAPQDSRVFPLDGTWNLTLSSPIGEQTLKLVLATNGASVTGVATGVQGSRDVSQEIANGKRDGNKVTWQMSITQPVSMTLNFSGIAGEHRIAGTVKGGAFLSFPFSGTRD